MEIKVDLKSLLIGVLLGLVITMTIAAIDNNPQKSNESGPGRFKLILGDKRVYIMDSTNGRPWSMASDSRSGNNRDNFWMSKFDVYEKEETANNEKRR